MYQLSTATLRRPLLVKQNYALWEPEAERADDGLVKRWRLICLPESNGAILIARGHSQPQSHSVDSKTGFHAFLWTFNVYNR